MMQSLASIGYFSFMIIVFLGAATVRAKEFHLKDNVGKADGMSDDGPAILRMIEAARAVKGGTSTVALSEE